MKKYLKESIILVIQLLIFYVLPAFAGPTDMMGVVVLLLMATFVLSVIIATVSNLKFKYLYLQPILLEDNKQSINNN